MTCPVMNWIFLGIGAIAAYALFVLLKQWNATKKLERWNKTPKNLVIVHGFPAAKTLPNASPFVLKVETFLRMANIPYKLDTKDFFGPKGKSPWISIDQQHIADSEMILEFLTKKFEINLNKNVNEEQLAIANVVKIMLEEHFFWGVALERFSFGGFKHLEKVVTLPFLSVLKYLVRRTVQKNALAQGTGRHSNSEVVHLMTKDLRAVSKLLGNKNFFGGNEPCEYDAGIFSMLAQCEWGLPESPYQKLVNGELKNLKEYCIRMKIRYWADWDHSLAR